MASKNPEIPTIFYGEPSLLPLPQYGFCRQNSILWCWNWFGWNINHRFHQHYAGHYLLPKSTSFGDWVQPMDGTNLHNAHCQSWFMLYCQWCLLGYPHSMRLLWKSCRGNIWRSFARSTQGFCSMAEGSWCIVIPKTIQTIQCTLFEKCHRNFQYFPCGFCSKIQHIYPGYSVLHPVIMISRT